MKKRIVIAALLLIAVIVVIVVATRHHKTKQQDRLHGACISNLRLLDSVKVQFAISNNVPDGAEISWEDVKPFFPSTVSTPFDCPAGGKYDLRRSGEDPACSIHGSLEQAIESKQKKELGQQ